jgi:hypothetical protein
MEKEDSKSAREIVLDNKRLLALFAGLILICGSFFIFGFITGRRAFVKNSAPPAASPSAKKKAAPKEFLDPKCHIPFCPNCNDLEFFLLDVEEGRPKPTQEQMAQIRLLLPKDTRIHDTARLDVDPPLAFVLHQPQPRTSSDSELTLFRFTKDGAESEDLGSYCFIPDFLIDRKGRAIASWSENPTGGNAWSCSSLDTMIIEKGEVSRPEIKLNNDQVAKFLILDRGVAVLIIWDTRFEYFEGLCRACSPIQQSIFALNRRGVWTDATSRHRCLVKEWIQDDIKNLQEAQAGNDKDEIGRLALNLYLNAENAGLVPQYRNIVKRALRKIGWSQFIDMIDQAARRKCRLVDLSAMSEDSDEIEVEQIAANELPLSSRVGNSFTCAGAHLVTHGNLQGDAKPKNFTADQHGRTLMNADFQTWDRTLLFISGCQRLGSRINSRIFHLFSEQTSITGC